MPGDLPFGLLHLFLQALVGRSLHPGLLELLLQLPIFPGGGRGGGRLLLCLVKKRLYGGQLFAQDQGAHGAGALPQLPGGVFAQLLGPEFQLAQPLLERSLLLGLPTGAVRGEGLYRLPERLRLPLHFQGLLIKLRGLFLILRELGHLLGEISGTHLIPRTTVVDTGSAGLGIELENHTAQGGLAAAGLAHHA